MDVIYAIEKWILLVLSFGLGSCLLATLTFSLIKAGRRADEGEERILAIFLSTRSGSKLEDAHAKIPEVSVTG